MNTENPSCKSSGLSTDFTIAFVNGRQHLYLPEETTFSEFTIPGNEHKVYYSIGIYRIEDDSDLISSFTVSNPSAPFCNYQDLKLISTPAVFCYTEDNGCMDTKYTGKWYPEMNYQYCRARYTLNSDMISADCNGHEKEIEGNPATIRVIL